MKPVSSVSVSKKVALVRVKPSDCRPAASVAARRCTRCAMRFRPCGPWYTAYIDAITASSTCAVQMFEVAFSRRICCSRVCSARRYALLPCASTVTPTRRPGIERLNASFTAM
ncbi:hypothetical protein D3C72_1980720 [compost metagenome]